MSQAKIDPESDKDQRRRLTVRLTLVFLLALVMGPGPGAYLLDPDTVFTCLGFPVPALYAWLVLWFLVMAMVVVVASARLWGRGDEELEEDWEES